MATTANSNYRKANKSNYKKLEQILKKNGIDFYKLNYHQYRIFGPVALVDIWPARMSVHILKTEGVDPDRYFRLDYHINEKQVLAILNGEEIK